MEKVNASDFKARCLAILDEVQRTGEGITILKHGKAVAQLLPVTPQMAGYPQETLRHSVVFIGDVVEPTEPPEVWEAEAG